MSDMKVDSHHVPIQPNIKREMLTDAEAVESAVVKALKNMGKWDTLFTKMRDLEEKGSTNNLRPHTWTSLKSEHQVSKVAHHAFTGKASAALKAIRHK